MLFRESMIGEVERAGCLDDALVVWSLWRGYLTDTGGALNEFLARHDVPMLLHHTSGHASVADLQRLVAAVEPTRVVPIHTFAPQRFGEFFPGAELHDDTTWWHV